jgi:hypothetical protein
MKPPWRRWLAGLCFSGALALACGTNPPPRPLAPPTPLVPDPQLTRLAVIGDYGMNNTPEAEVAALVHSWNPDLVITVGDNNYPSGETSTIDANIGQFYLRYIYPYSGTYGTSAAPNRFYPALGNHDWVTPNGQPYLDYFALPGNERYYTVTAGPVDLFALDSDTREPDGVGQSSAQALWLQTALTNSVAPWKIVYMHHPPYSSSSVHGPTEYMQWPYAAWGADVVLAGHDHTYERLSVGGFPYLVVGTGGAGLYAFGTPIAGSLVRYNADYGALLITATPQAITYQFITRAGEVIDTFTQTKSLAKVFVPITRR